MVTRLMANTDTSVTMVISRSAVNAPKIASPPTSSGMPAAASAPNTTTSSTSSSGIDRLSARAMSRATWVLASRPTATSPPTRVVRPGAASSSSICASAFSRASPSAPASSSTA